MTVHAFFRAYLDTILKALIALWISANVKYSLPQSHGEGGGQSVRVRDKERTFRDFPTSTESSVAYFS